MGGKKNAIGDTNKPRLSLIPKEALWSMGRALSHGEIKYGTHNWREGIKISYLLDAALRHIIQFNDGEDIDKDSNNHHLGNAMADLAMALELLHTNPELDDRHKRDGNLVKLEDGTTVIEKGSKVVELPGGTFIVEKRT